MRGVKHKLKGIGGRGCQGVPENLGSEAQKAVRTARNWMNLQYIL